MNKVKLSLPIGTKIRLSSESKYYYQAPNIIGILIEHSNDGWDYKVRFEDLGREYFYNTEDLIKVDSIIEIADNILDLLDKLDK